MEEYLDGPNPSVVYAFIIFVLSICKCKLRFFVCSITIYSSWHEVRMEAKTNNVKHENVESGDENRDDVPDPDHACGLGSWQPKWLQKFASKKAYVVAYCTLSLCQGIFYTYIISILTTVEKRFAVSSKASGFVMTGNEFSQILGGFFVGYLGNRGHKPVWMAIGMYISALSCFMMALPEFALPLEEQAHSSLNFNSSQTELCLASNSSIVEDRCKDRNFSTTSFVAMSMLFIGMFVSGFGTLPIHSLGYTYMDDNVSKKKIPTFLGISFALRIIGPALGFILGGSVLRIHHDLKTPPNISPKDPRWIGAWWLGFVIIGVLISISAFFMLMFPRELPKRKKRETNTNQVNCTPIKHPPIRSKTLPPLRGLPTALKRLAKNPILVAQTIEAVIYLLGVVGFSTFFPKYIESQFGQSASGASYITGFSSISVMIIGYVISGFVIQRYKPRPRILSAYSMFIGLIQIGALIWGMFIMCENNLNLSGKLSADGRTLDLINSCNADCSCTTSKFTPVCDNNNSISYFSGCHMGCLSYNDSTKSYADCSCGTPAIGMPPLITDTGESLASEIWYSVTKGKCSFVCNAFFIYIAMKTVSRLLGSTERVGGTIILLRAVHPEDKSLMLGWINVFLCLFAFMPCTILYGALVDSMCLVWEETCGERGNCWVYDPDKMRLWLHGFTAILLVISNFFQLIVWYKCKNVKLYEEVEDLSENPNQVEEITLQKMKDQSPNSN